MAYSEGLSEEALEQAEESELQGYVLHGDIEALRALSPELILEAVRAKLGELGVEPAVEVTPVADLSPLAEFAESGEQEAAPVPATKELFRAWAAGHGYSDSRACITWNRIWYTAVRDDQNDPVKENMPRLRWVSSPRLNGIYDARSDEPEVVDLRSVYDRLVASDLKSSAWVNGLKADVNFLVAIVNDLVDPENQLYGR